MTGGAVWALALLAGGVAVAAVSRDQLAALRARLVDGWRAARSRRTELRQLDRDGWNRP